MGHSIQTIDSQKHSISSREGLCASHAFREFPGYESCGGAKLATPAFDPSKNNILAALQSDESTRLSRHLESVTLRLREVIQKAGETIRYVYFHWIA